MSGHPSRRAFTLLEVMIASALFFMAIFAILSLVSTNIRNAHYLQEQHADAGMLLADMVQTNVLTLGGDSGDFGNLYPGYRWESQVTPAGTNGIFEVDIAVIRPGGGPNSITTLSAFLYRPDTPLSQ